MSDSLNKVSVGASVKSAYVFRNPWSKALTNLLLRHSAHLHMNIVMGQSTLEQDETLIKVCLFISAHFSKIFPFIWFHFKDISGQQLAFIFDPGSK